MVFFKEEINEFNLAYFEKTCASLELENAIQYYCRDTFRKGIPKLDEDVLKLITLDLEHRYMYDTRLKRSKWGHVSIPRELLDDCAKRILAKVVVFRRLQADEMSRTHASERLRAEMEEKADVLRKKEVDQILNEARRKAELRRADNQALLGNDKKAASVFPSLSEILKVDRYTLVKELIHNATYYESIPDFSRKRKNDDNDGIIYCIINRLNKKIYVGQTLNFDARMYKHSRKNSGTKSLAHAVSKYGWCNFMCVILLAGIAQRKELNLAEIELIRHFDCLTYGYNINSGGHHN